MFILGSSENAYWTSYRGLVLSVNFLAKFCGWGGATSKCRLKIGNFVKRGTLHLKFHVAWVATTDNFYCHWCRVYGLSCGHKKVGTTFFSFATNHAWQRDGRTDGHAAQ